MARDSLKKSRSASRSAFPHRLPRMPSTPDHGLLRRDFFAQLSTFAAAAAGVSVVETLPGLNATAVAAEPKPSTAAALAPLNRFPRMVQECFVARVREVEAHANQRRAALKTKA